MKTEKQNIFKLQKKLYNIYNNNLLRRDFFMKNCEMKLDGNILTITVDVSKEFGTSSSGKSIIISSTEGNVSIPGKDEVKIGLNVYRKP